MLEGLKQVAEIVHPRTFNALRKAGTLGPMSPVAVTTALPWLVGRGPSLGIVSRMNALVVGDKTAIHDAHASVTFKELEDLSNRVAEAFGDAGISGGDRVAILLRNSIEFASVLLAAQKIGVIACPLNTWAKPKELRATLEQAGPKLLVYDTRHSDALAAAQPEGIQLVGVGEEGEALGDTTMFGDLVAGQPGRPPRPFTRRRGSPKVVIHTSGTTGTPKGAQRDATSTGLGAVAGLLSLVPYRRDDIVVCPSPMFHSFGLATFTFATVLGSTLVLPDAYTPVGTLEAIEAHRATAVSLVPVMVKRIVDLPASKRDFDLSSLRIVLASGSAMSADLRSAARDVFGDVLYDLYGSTEAGWVAIATPADMDDEPRTVGRPSPGVEVALFDESHRPVPTGEVGEIYVRSQMTFEGYTSGDNRPEHDGYISVGDLGRFDDRGYLFVEGRADDMVVVGGENVYPVEIEEVIEGIEGVTDAAVMGVEDQEFGQVLAAFVAGDVTEEAVAAACRDQLASYKVPRRIEIMDELPRTSTGKILKRELDPGGR